jgi:hypothetical protein
MAAIVTVNIGLLASRQEAHGYWLSSHALPEGKLDKDQGMVDRKNK